jgi:hypothetical protein
MSTAAATANHASTRSPVNSHATTAGINAIRRNTWSAVEGGLPDTAPPTSPSRLAATTWEQSVLKRLVIGVLSSYVVAALVGHARERSGAVGCKVNVHPTVGAADASWRCSVGSRQLVIKDDRVRATTSRPQG